MSYGTIKVDTITFTDGGVDKSVSVSGLTQSPTFTGNVTVTGTVSGNLIQGQTVSGATVTGNFGQFTNVTGGVGLFAAITGNSATITSITGTNGNFTNLNFTAASGLFSSGSAGSPSVAVGTSTNGLYSPGTNQIAIATSGQGRVFVDSSGNVGIGSSPSARFLVSGITNGSSIQVLGTASGDYTFLQAQNPGSGVQFQITANGVGAAEVRCVSVHPLDFYTANTVKARITTGGNLGIGLTSNIQAPLTISKSGGANPATSGTTQSSGLIARIGSSSIAACDIGTTAAGATWMQALSISDLSVNFPLLLNPNGGNVGINHPAPDNALAIRNGSISLNSPGTSISGRTTERYLIRTDNGSVNGVAAISLAGANTNGFQGQIKFYGGLADFFDTALVERATIDSAGRFLVGSSVNVQQFGVSPAGQFTGLNGAGGYLGLTVFNSTADSAPSLVLGHSKGATVGTYTAAASGDLLGSLSYTAANGTDMRRGAAIESYADGIWGTNNHPGRLVFAVTAVSGSAPAGKMALTSSGALVIGAANPVSGHLLDVRGPVLTTKSYRSYNASTDPNTDRGFRNTIDGNELLAFYHNNSGAIFEVNGSERARITADGLLLVATQTAYSVENFARNSYFAPAGFNQNNQMVISSFSGGFPGIYFTRTKGTSVTAQSIVANADLLGSIRFFGSDGVDYANAAGAISCNVDGTPGVDKMPGRISFATTPETSGAFPVEHVRLTAAGLLGVGTLSPGAKLDVRTSLDSGVTNNLDLWNTSTSGNNQGALLRLITRNAANNSTSSTDIVKYQGGESSFRATDPSGFFTFHTAGYNERVRIDTLGRILIGLQTASQFNSYSNNNKVQLAAAADSPDVQMTSFRSDQFGSVINFGKSRSATLGTNTAVQDGDWLGTVNFVGANGTDWKEGARIVAFVDGSTWTSSGCPGRLSFQTTSGTTITERARITSSGYFKASNDGTYSDASNTGTVHELNSTHPSNAVIWITARNANYAGQGILLDCVRAANTGYSFLNARSNTGTTADTEFNLRGDGNAFADGTWTGGGADYAEYFEWSDSNPNEEDRRGISVVLDGDKIREALAGEDPIGVISGNPSVIGDAAWNKWIGKYLRDEFGSYIQEDYEVTDENGNTVTQQRRKLNPAYDPDIEYIPREERPEWDCVGMMGKLRIRKGQVIGSRWIKMRDISASVEEWLVR